MVRSISTEQVSCLTCPYRENSKWMPLGDEELELLNTAKICKIYEPAETIYLDHDECRGIHCIRSGIVITRKYNSEGESYILGGLKYPGSTLGFAEMSADENYQGSAEALEPALTCFIDKKTVTELLIKNPSLRFKFLENAAIDLGEAELDLFLRTTHPIRTRLARLLMIFEKRGTKTNEDGSKSFKIPFSRTDLSAMVGAHPESVRRTILTFRDENIAYFSGRTVTIPDSGRLTNEFQQYFAKA